MDEPNYIIVVGASAGGIPAISSLCTGLPADLRAAVFVVLHMSALSSGERLARIFQRHTGLVCQAAEDGEVIRAGHLYVAQPNHHLLLSGEVMKLNQGTRENKYRPSIDVLFRSAAVAYRSRVIGVILSGMLEDGTSGMYAIKRCGGICIVQEPEEAQFSDMPQSVLNRLEVDYRLPVADMGNLLAQLAERPVATPPPVPRELAIEAKITENMTSTIDELKQIGDKSDFACPDCGGGLYAIKNDPVNRYRCHTGHVYTEQLLHDIQGLHLEESVWVSVRMLEERHNLLLLMVTHALENGQEAIADSRRQQAAAMEKHIAQLKLLLYKLMEDLVPLTGTDNENGNPPQLNHA
jgi:two-component system chemotaxis response regulator CheB